MQSYTFWLQHKGPECFCIFLCLDGLLVDLSNDLSSLVSGVEVVRIVVDEQSQPSGSLDGLLQDLSSDGCRPDQPRFLHVPFVGHAES